MTGTVMFDWGVNYRTRDNRSIEKIENFTYLGVNFDKKMTFNRHVNEVSAQSIRNANAAARLSKNIGNRSLNVKFYNIYNAPKINYASII